MGYYDGLGGVTDTASAWQLADTLDLPALLVVRPQGGKPDAGGGAARADGVPHTAPYRGDFAQ